LTKGVPQVGAEIVKGAAGLALLPGELLRLGINKLTGNEDAEPFAATEMVRGAVDSVVPPPETKTGQTGVKIAGAVGSAAALPGRFMRNAAANLGGQAGAEVGAGIGTGMAGDNGAVIGGVVGGLTGGAPFSVMKGRGTHREMLAEAVKGLNARDFAQARRTLADAEKAGVVLTPEQLFRTESGLDELFRSTLRSGAGDGKLQQKFLAQALENEAAARRGGNRLGPLVEEGTATRELRRQTAEGLDDLGRTTPTVSRLYQEAPGTRVEGPRLEQLDADLAVLQDGFKGSKEISARIADVRQRLGAIAEKQKFAFGTTTQVTPATSGKAAKWQTKQVPNELEVNLGTDPQQLDMVAKSVQALISDMRLGEPSMERFARGPVGAAVGRLKDTLTEVIPTRPQGSELVAAIKQRQADMTSGLPGRVAGRSGPDERLPDPRGMLARELNPDYPQASEISQLAGLLRDRARTQRAQVAKDPSDVGAAQAAAESSRALPQAVRSVWERELDKAFAAGTSGRVSGEAGAKFAASLTGTPAKAANFQRLMQEAGQTLGANPAEFADGMKSLMTALQASGRNRAGVTLAAGEIRDMQGQTPLRDVVRAFGPLSRPQMIAEKLRGLGQDRQYAKLADIFNDPQAIGLIEELGRTPLGTSRSGAIIQTLLGASSEPVMTREGAQQ
jgi:hypothetical protein